MQSRYFFLGAIFIFLVSCRPHEGAKMYLDKKAVSVWNHHEEIVEGVIEGELPAGAVPLVDFQTSCFFFQELTGIPARIDFPYVGGAVSTDKTPEDLKRWRAWFKDNKHLLYWDEQNNSVRLRGP